MASPPFDITTSIPGDSDLISIHPAQARTYRDIVESWLLLLSDTYGRVKVLSGDTTARDALTSPGTNILFLNTDFTPAAIQRYNGATWDNLSPIAATEAAAGLAEIATQAETNAGTDDARIVTALKLKSWTPGPATVTLAPATDKVLIADASDSGKLKLAAISDLANSCFRATSATGTTLTASTWVRLPFATEVFDTNSNYAAPTFTPTVAGKYLITAQAQAAAVTKANIFRLAIYVNGSAVIYDEITNVTTGPDEPMTCRVSAIVDLNGSTDYVEIYAWCDDPSPTSITTNAALNQFMGVRVA